MSTPLDKGVFTLSIDTELAWGFNHLPLSRHPNEHLAQVREVVDRLLRLMERYEISATWAVVGHLFLPRCGPWEETPHPDVQAPSYSWLHRDGWFDTDPGSGAEQAPLRYGPDIIDMIVDCHVAQEIGSHTFSHIIVGDPGCSEESFDSELAECRRLAEARGIDLCSFVYPKNSVGHTRTLVKRGFRAYRGVQSLWFDGFPFALWRVAHKIDAFLPIPLPVEAPRWEDGIWNLPASYYYPHRNGWWGGLLPIWMRVLKSKGALRRAARRNSVFHLWFHPYNLATDAQGLFRGLEQIFQEVNRLRDRGVLENLTMVDLANRLNAAHASSSAAATQRGGPGVAV